MSRRFLIILLVGVLTLAPIPARALSLFNLKNELIQFLLEQISDPGVFEITVETVETPEEGGTRLVNIEVKDAQGPWLTMTSAEFDWNPSRLVKGEIEISRIVLDHPVMTRLPEYEAAAVDETEPEAADEGFAWPRSPLALFVREFKAIDVEVKEGVLPQEVRFGASGSVRDEGDEQALSFELTRQDQVEGRIALDYLRDFASRTLRLHLVGREAPGGLVANLSGLPPDVPVRVDLAAEGPDQDWALELDLAAEEVIRLTGMADASWQAPMRLDAAFDLTPGPKLDDASRLLLEPAATLRFLAEESREGRIAIERAQVKAPDLHAELSGWIERDSGELALEVTTQLGAGLSALAEGMTFETVTFAGKAQGTMDELQATGTASADKLVTAAAKLEAAEFNLSLIRKAPRIEFEIDGRGDQAEIAALGPDPLDWLLVSSKGSMEGEVLSLEAAELSTEGLQASVSGQVSTSGLLDLAADLEATQRLADRVEGVDFEKITFVGTARGRPEDLVADGKFDLQALKVAAVTLDRFAMTGHMARSQQELDFQLSGQGLGPHVDRLGPDVLGDIDLVLAGRLSDTLLHLDQAEIRTAVGLLEAEGAIPLGDGDLNASYSLNLPEVAPLAKAYGVAAEGALQANGQAKGPIARLLTEGTLEARGATIEGKELGRLRLDHDVALGVVSEGHLAIAVSESLVGDGMVDADFRLDGNRLEISPLTGAIAKLRIEGDIATDLETLLSEGAINVSSDDLSAAGKLIELETAGAFDGRVNLANDAERQSLSWRLSGQGLAMDALLVESLMARGQVEDLLGSPALDLSAEASGLLSGETRLATTEITATGPVNDLDISLATAGTAAGVPLTAEGEANVLQEATARSISVSRLDASFSDEPLFLGSPLEINLSEGLVEIDGLDVRLPDEGRVEGQADLRPAGLSGQLALQAVPLRLAEVFAEVPIKAGTLSGDLSFDTRAEFASATGTFGGRSLRLNGVPEDSGVFDLGIEVNWDGATAGVSGELSGDFGEPATFSLDLPVIPGDGPVPEVQSDGPLSGDVAWRGEIAPLWSLVPMPDHLLAGRAAVDARVAGSLSNPKVSGEVSLVEGRYQNLTAGTVLTGLTLATSIEDGRTVKVALSATDGADGRVVGDIALELVEKGFSIDANLTSDRAILVRRDDVVARVDAALSILGSAEALAVTGDISVTEAEIRLINRVPPNVVDLGPVRVKGEPGPASEEDDTSTITLDIKVRAPGRIFIRGRGLESEWAISLDVTGSAARPIVVGEISALRGRLDLVGRQFQLTEGEIAFSGGREIDPSLNIVLAREANDLIGRVILSGYASDPEIRFESTPEVPQDEVLPRVIFGRSAQSLSAFEAAQLAAGIATLTSGEAGVIDTVRSSLGLDVMQIDTDEDETSSLTVGRYVTDNVFVGARQALDGQSGAAIVEMEVIENIILDAELGHEGESSTGVNWRFDF